MKILMFLSSHESEEEARRDAMNALRERGVPDEQADIVLGAFNVGGDVGDAFWIIDNTGEIEIKTVKC